MREPFLDDSRVPTVRGILHAAEERSSGALVLTHGAGGNANAPFLVALAHAFADRGVSVLRCDLPFRQARATGPPRPGDAARDRDGLARAAELMRRRFGGPIFVGGQSYGGRQASMLVADEPDHADGLLLLSYPLHPPGRPTQLRTSHFPLIKKPVLVVQGTRDPFGSLEELEAAMRLLAGPSRHLTVPGAGHDLARHAGSSPLALEVAEAFLALVGPRS